MMMNLKLQMSKVLVILRIICWLLKEKKEIPNFKKPITRKLINNNIIAKLSELNKYDKELI